MRILIVNRHIDQTAGGSETQCHEIACALTARGHDVVYAVCCPGETHREHPYAVLPLRGPFRAAFRDALLTARPDVVYWRYNKRHLLGSVLDARRAGTAFVFAVSHINDVRPIAVKPFYGADLGRVRRLLRMLGRARIAAASTLNHLALGLVDGVVYQHAGQIPAGANGTHVVIPNSARPAMAAGHRGSGAPRPGTHGGPPEPSAPFVLWASSIKQSKNPEAFIRLAADLAHTGIEFVMAGHIQDRAYRALLESDGLPRNFRYLGHQPRDALDSLMDRCLLLAHTCAPEGFPNVFIQAWACGKPVASLHFDPGGLLAAHNIGLCAGGDYRAFKADVERLIGDESLRTEIGRRALAFVAEHCDRERNVATLERFFADLLTARAA